ncbi:hypothetical protein Afe04nite_56660 [Asanoa ferruginea]|uniref:hypothetical protein n=1 Tax=Asanoa ferruginea TaxID=53367 RepID=UPI000E289927|nr:hypothetical protein [Asanoa ferruginea]GIF51127.1 hypothetical protein Afe04nite_56660 [Asanoa ferruginea]
MNELGQLPLEGRCLARVEASVIQWVDSGEERIGGRVVVDEVAQRVDVCGAGRQSLDDRAGELFDMHRDCHVTMMPEWLVSGRLASQVAGRHAARARRLDLIERYPAKERATHLCCGIRGRPQAGLHLGDLNHTQQKGRAVMPLVRAAHVSLVPLA